MAKLGDVCTFVRGPFGGSLKKSTFVSNGYAVYEQQHAIYNQFENIRYFINKTKFKEMQRFEIRADDLIMSCSGTMGRIAIVPKDVKPGIINQALLKLTPGAAILNTFLKPWMESEAFQDAIKEYSGGAAIQNVASVKVLKEIAVPLPSIQEQQRIVAILDEAFEGIATAKANAEQNLQNARAIFESQLQSVFDQRVAGWVETTIGDQVTFQRGFDITKNQQTLGNVPVVSSGGIKSFHDTAMAKAPGVVIGRKGTLGKVFYLSENFWPHDTTLWIKDFKGNHPRFVYYFLRNLDVAHLDTGTANPALNRNVLHQIHINWPRLDMQPSLVTMFDNLEINSERLANIYERKLAALDELKKSLLQRAFAGELTASKTSELIEAVA